MAQLKEKYAAPAVASQLPAETEIEAVVQDEKPLDETRIETSEVASEQSESEAVIETPQMDVELETTDAVTEEIQEKEVQVEDSQIENVQMLSAKTEAETVKAED